MSQNVEVYVAAVRHQAQVESERKVARARQEGEFWDALMCLDLEELATKAEHVEGQVGANMRQAISQMARQRDELGKKINGR